MQSGTNNKDPLREVGQLTEGLCHLSQELINVIDKQTKAVVAADEEQIEQNAERYANLKGVFKEQEDKLVNRLQKLVGQRNKEVNDIGLEQLKGAFPESTETIDEWKKKLGKQVRQLKGKHIRLNQLLEFALHRNVELMHSIYGLHNQKNTHYGSDGSKEKVSSGIAINKEA